MKVNYNSIYDFSISKSEIKTEADVDLVAHLISMTYLTVCVETYIRGEDIQELLDNPKRSLIIKDEDTGAIELQVRTFRNRIEVLFDFDH